jgi:hypothetical protein
MNTINLRKKTKKLKLILKNTLISKFACNKEIIIHGPLGTVSYIFKNQPLLTENNFFIKTADLNFFLSKIKKLIKSVSTG